MRCGKKSAKPDSQANPRVYVYLYTPFLYVLGIALARCQLHGVFVLDLPESDVCLTSPSPRNDRKLHPLCVVPLDFPYAQYWSMHHIAP